MGIPGQSDNPFKTIIEVGNLRREANRLAELAGLLEGSAKLKLAELGINIAARGLPPKQTLAQPFGGAAHGKTQFVPLENFPVFSLVAPAADNIVGLHRYQVGMVIRVGPGMVAAVLVVPEGDLRTMYQRMRDRSEDIQLAVTEMIVRSVGIQTDLIDHIVNSMQQTAELTGENPEDPIIVMLGNG